MKTTTQLLGAVSAFALVVMSSAPALAQGTSAGSLITNNVTVTYDVNGIAQTAETAFDTFTVDQKVNVNVEFVGAATTVTPGQQNAAIAFDVTNLSNSTIDLALTTALTAGVGGNIANFEIYLDTNGDRVLDGTELAAGPITFLDEVAASALGTTVAVIVVADIGLGAVNGNEFDVVLTANAHEAGAAGLGSELVATAGANTAGVDTVLADGLTPYDAANEGDFSDVGQYVVAGAVVDVAKTSRIISDPVNGTTNPKAIPGAVVEYCITVANASGASTATGVSVLDDLPADVSFLTGTIRINGDANCENGAVGGLYDAGAGVAGQVSGSLTDIAGGETRSLYFQVEID